MRQQKRLLAFAAALIIGVANVASMAQQTLDRTQQPKPGSIPELRVPAVVKQLLR